MAGADRSGTIRSGERLIEIIQTLQELSGAGVTELAEYLEMDRSHVHKYLKTLESKGYVSNDDGHYELSFMFIIHSEHTKRQSRLCQVAENRTRELANSIEDVVKFSVRQGNYSIGVYSEHDDNIFQKEYLPGKRDYLHQSAPGKAILAKFSDGEIERYIEDTGLPARGEGTITNGEHLREEIAAIRDRGFAVSRGEWDERINGIGAAIVSPTGQLGAINIFGPASSLSQEYLIDEYSDHLKRVTSQIEHKLQR